MGDFRIQKFELKSGFSATTMPQEQNVELSIPRTGFIFDSFGSMFYQTWFSTIRSTLFRNRNEMEHYRYMKIAYSASENSCQIPWHATSYTILMSEMSVQHSSTGSTLQHRSFMQNQDFTFPPPLLDHSQTLAHYADPGYSHLMASSYGPQSMVISTSVHIIHVFPLLLTWYAGSS
ncbi:hypothetical protein V8G54_025714 [Vigna mungo]|uniref:Uncharacterized protein n=1 Tax=Vigna mungo TaxID=3915 RepID=A0AAQ3MZI1_VIGMU